MAAPAGQLFPGLKKKIINYLSSDGCPTKTTAALCKAFPILWHHKDFVTEMAKMFTLEPTVKQFSVNRLAGHNPGPVSPPQDDQAAAEEEEALAQAESQGRA